MSDCDKLPNSSPDLDDELAKFTEDLLDGNIELEEAENNLSENEELRALQKMVLRMHRAFGSEQPSPSMSSRMKMNLVTEFRKMDFREKEKPVPIWTRIQDSLFGSVRGRGLNMLMPIAAIAAVFLIVFVFVFSDGKLNISGTVLSVPERMEEVVPLAGATMRVSVNSSGGEVDNDSWYSAISADGRYVAFVSASDDLVNNDTNGVRDIFVHDQNSGTTERVSLGVNGQEGNGDSLNPAISADGRFVAFESQADNLVSGDGNNARDIFIRDRQTSTTQLISAVNGQAANGDSRFPAISNDGRFIAFYSTANNIAANDTNGVGDVFLFDRQNGAMTAVSVTSGGQVGDGESRNPAVSGNGQFVAFESVATNLVANDTNNRSDIFLYAGQSGSIERISVSPNNEEGDGHSYNPDLSDDGQFVAFESFAENLFEGDGNEYADIFVYYRDGNNQIVIELATVSMADGGGQGNGDSSYASISADGRYVTYSSFANNLAGGEIYGNYLDIYIFDRQEEITERISADPLDQEPDGASVNPDVSADGRFVSFDSTGSNLVSDDTNSRVDVFLRDRTPPVSLTINYRDGATGSYFTVTGNNYLPDSSIDLIVNGTNLGTTTSDADGSFMIILATDNADPGGYALRAVAGTLEGFVSFMVDQNAALRPQENQAAVFNIPPGIAYTHFNSMPGIFKK